MMPDVLINAIIAGSAAITGGFIVSVFGYGYWQRLHKKVDDSAKRNEKFLDDNLARMDKKIDNNHAELDQKIDKDIEKLDQKIDEHIKADKSQMVLTEVRNLSGLVSKLNDKVDNLTGETSRQGEAIRNNADFNRNLYGSHQILREAQQKLSEELHKK